MIGCEPTSPSYMNQEEFNKLMYILKKYNIHVPMCLSRRSKYDTYHEHVCVVLAYFSRSSDYVCFKSTDLMPGTTWLMSCVDNTFVSSTVYLRGDFWTLKTNADIFRIIHILKQTIHEIDVLRLVVEYIDIQES
jgi:hypothetical protein